MGRGQKAGPARGATIAGANWGARGELALPNQRSLPGPPSLKRSLSEKSLLHVPGPVESFSLFTPGAAGEGAAPRMARELGRLPKIKEAGDARIILGVSFKFGAPLTWARVQGHPECQLLGLEFQSKDQSQSCVLGDSHLQRAFLDGG